MVVTSPRPSPEPLAGRLALDAYLALSPDAVVAVDAEGRVERANPLAAELFGYPLDELVGTDLEELLPERFRAAHRSHRREYLDAPRTRRMGTGMELWARRRDGTEFPVDVSLAPLEAPGGPVVVAAVRDVTERLQGQEAQALLAAIVGSSADAIASMTTDGTITSWNPGAEALLGYRPSEIIGQPHSVLVPDDRKEELARAVERLLAGGRVERFETRRRASDGREVDVECALTALRDRSGRIVGIAGTLRDMTAQHQAQKALARAQHEHEQLAVMADRERIARDLHDLVIQRLFAGAMKLQGTMSIVSGQAAERIAAVVGDLDTTIKEIRTAVFALEHRPGDDASLRASVLDLVAEMAEALGHEPLVSFDGPLDASVDEDVASHLLAVLREALSNVARHAHASSTRVELAANGTELVLQVTDNGVGLGASTRTSGLANIRRRAESLGGTARALSRPAGGTLLEWRVPLPTRSA